MSFQTFCSLQQWISDHFPPSIDLLHKVHIYPRYDDYYLDTTPLIEHEEDTIYYTHHNDHYEPDIDSYQIPDSDSNSDYESDYY